MGPLFVVFLFVCCLTTSSAQQYITSFPCSEDSECNRGTCVPYKDGHYCKCDKLYYPKEVDGMEAPCVAPLGKIHPAGVTALFAINQPILLFILILHVSIVFTLSSSSQVVNKRINSWQFDPRITLILLAIACCLSPVFNGFYGAYLYGYSNETSFSIVGDFIKVVYLEAVTAAVFYWYLAMRPSADRAARFPVLIVTLVIYLIWWAIASFAESSSDSVNISITYFKLAGSLVFILILVCGLFYFGAQILVLLGSQKDSTGMASRVSFLIIGAALALVIRVALLGIAFAINSANSPLGALIISMHLVAFVEILIHLSFLAMFSGSLRHVVRGVAWAWKGRAGKSPIDYALL